MLLIRHFDPEKRQLRHFPALGCNQDIRNIIGLRWSDPVYGGNVPPSFKLLGFDSYDNVIQSALDGQGIALGFSGLPTRYLDAGRLVRPIDGSLTLGHAVFLVVPTAGEPIPVVQQFVDWVLQEADSR